ncbi:hypothetical protein ACFYKX_05775 [Cytobacillus sp. FJAT-54145]|uniref:Uncharacterized protein n=1 Tax=Cytobacillus spartinae TaxID=3299023 RepID=A0ABW6K936_9BACI
MNPYLYRQGSPMYGLGQQESQALAQIGWPQPNQSFKGQVVDEEFQKGNTCAYVPSTPVQYYKLQIAHWPSQDYSVPHPKGFAHTLHNVQILGQHSPSRNEYGPYLADALSIKY